MRAQEAGVTRVIIPAVDVPSGDTALALSASHEGIFAAVGIHPNSPTLEITRLREDEMVTSSDSPMLKKRQQWRVM